LRSFRKAFSIIEIVFVIVILGIVASIASDIIVQVYDSYIVQRAVYRVNYKTELAVNEIVNRLTYRIEGTTISKNHNNFKNGSPNSDDWLPIAYVPERGTKYKTIEWIGYDNDSFSSDKLPNWSGVANYKSASIDGFQTLGSDLKSASTIISYLSDGTVDLTEDRPAAVIFMQKNNYYSGISEYTPECMGMIPELFKSTDCIFPVYADGNDTLKFTRKNDPNSQEIRHKIITERYKLAWSAYSLVPEPKENGLFDLYLYSNYQPWNGDSYLDAKSKNILIDNVSVFKFEEDAGTIHFKLCIVERISEDNNISTCKEKVVIR
jgi:prepilin-type N-terminal cleavage/methylation domain-containing protein